MGNGRFTGNGSEYLASNGVRIRFRSSAFGEAHYDVWTPRSKENQTVEYRFFVDRYRPGVWNYTEEEYENVIRCAYQILHTYFNEAVSPEILKAFREMEAASAREARREILKLFEKYPDLKPDRYTFTGNSCTPVYNGYFDHDGKRWVRLLNRDPSQILEPHHLPDRDETGYEEGPSF